MVPTIPTGYRVDKSAWALALLSLTLVGALCWGIIAVAGEVRSVVAHIELRSAIGQGRWEEARHHLDSLLKVPKIFRLTNHDLRPRDEVIRGAPDFYEFVTNDKKVSTEGSIEQLHGLLRRNELLIDRIADGGQIETLRGLLRSLEQRSANLRQLEAHHSEVQTARDALATQFRSIADELAGLLNVPRGLLDETGQIWATYRSGILAGLPTVRNIPDNIVDLAMLRSQIDRLGGGVRLPPGANQFEVFQQALQGFQGRSKRLEAAGSQQLAELTDLETKITDIEHALSAELALIKLQIQGFIVTATAPGAEGIGGRIASFLLQHQADGGARP